MADKELLVITLTLGIIYSIIYQLHRNERMSLSQENLAGKPERRVEQWRKDGAAPG